MWTQHTAANEDRGWPAATKIKHDISHYTAECLPYFPLLLLLLLLLQLQLQQQLLLVLILLWRLVVSNLDREVAWPITNSSLVLLPNVRFTCFKARFFPPTERRKTAHQLLHSVLSTYTERHTLCHIKSTPLWLWHHFTICRDIFKNNFRSTSLRNNFCTILLISHSPSAWRLNLT